MKMKQFGRLQPRFSTGFGGQFPKSGKIRSRKPTQMQKAQAHRDVGYAFVWLGRKKAASLIQSQIPEKLPRGAASLFPKCHLNGPRAYPNLLGQILNGKGRGKSLANLTFQVGQLNFSGRWPRLPRRAEGLDQDFGHRFLNMGEGIAFFER